MVARDLFQHWSYVRGEKSAVGKRSLKKKKGARPYDPRSLSFKTLIRDLLSLSLSQSMLCTRDVCQGSSMGLYGLAKSEKSAEDALKEAREFMELFYTENKR